MSGVIAVHRTSLKLPMRQIAKTASNITGTEAYKIPHAADLRRDETTGRIP